jgi:glycosyltransferase involved in cell wall biosynthesis
MKVSIVIPALNEEKYLPKLLDSLSAQKTKFKYEIIVADGYSEDNTVKIAKKAGAKVVMEHNRSAAWERNAGAKIASGDIIAFVDSDTIVPKDWVERIGSEFENSKDVVMVYGCAYLLEESKLMNSLVLFSTKLFISILSFFGIHNAPGFNMAVRKDIYNKCGGFDTSLFTAEDLDLAKKMSVFGKIKFVPDLIVWVSARRIKKWGLLKFVGFNLANLFNFTFKGKASKNYESVR